MLSGICFETIQRAIETERGGVAARTRGEGVVGVGWGRFQGLLMGMEHEGGFQGAHACYLGIHQGGKTTRNHIL
jgi:hypothetical protein